MKPLLLLIICAASMGASAQAYDSSQARRWGADEYGMRMYVLVMLKTGPAVATTDKSVIDSLMPAHLGNIQRLADEGKMAVAGPMSPNDLHYEGLFVMTTSKLSEAKAWVESDPMVQRHFLEPVYLGFYCSASLMGIPEAHKTVQKKSF